MKTHKKLLIVASALIVPIIVGALSVSAVKASEENQTIIDRVAEILGVESEDVDEAFKQAQIERVDKLLVEGEIDEDQAEKMKERIEESDHPIALFGRRKKGMLKDENIDDISEFLGVTVEDIESFQGKGKSMHDLLDEYGKTREEWIDFMKEKYGDEFLEKPGLGNNCECDI